MKRKKKQVNAPAVIIAPEHQSAPNVPVMPNLNAPQGGGAWAREYDGEMGGGPCMESSDPRVNANVRALYQESLHEERLSAEEEAARQHEKSVEVMKQYRWRGQERWQGRENEEMRMVRILHAHTFMERLRRAGIRASTDDPYELLRAAEVPLHRWPKHEAALWLNSFVKVGRVGVTAWVKGEPKTICTLQYPFGPEWSIPRFNEYGVITNERYHGWRSALLALILEGVLSEDQAHRALGEPRGVASLYYREQLYYHRAFQVGVRGDDREEE